MTHFKAGPISKLVLSYWSQVHQTCLDGESGDTYGSQRLTESEKSVLDTAERIGFWTMLIFLITFGQH